MRTLLMALVLVLAPLNAATASSLEVDKKNALVIEGPISGTNILHLGELLVQAAAAGLPQVDLIINSPGGSIVTGFRFISMMDDARSRGMKIRCFVPEMAASMAFGILVHCDERHALSRSFLLWHRARVSVGGIFGSPLTAPQALAIGRDLAAVDNLILEETLGALKEMDPADVIHHFENETLHVGSNLHRMAPGFVTTHTYIRGLYDVLADEEVPRTKKSGGFFDMFQDGEIIYITPNLITNQK